MDGSSAGLHRRCIVEPLAWTAPHKVMAAGLSVGSAFMGIATDQWVVIAAGLSVGVFARSAYLMSLRKPIWRDLTVSVIMAPMNGVLASELVESIALHDARLLLATSLLASSSTMIFVEARRRFLQWHGTEEPTQIFTGPDTTVNIPASAGDVSVTSVGTGTPQTTAQVVIAELGKAEPITDHGDAIAELLRKLDEEE